MSPRPTRPEDVPAILALIGDIFAEYGLVFRPELDDPYLLDPGPYFRATGGEFWVVESDGSALATVAVKLHPDAGELKTLYVHRALRRQGWGRRLTQMAVDYARRARRMRFFLWSDTRFLDAHRLYAALGFTQSGERDLHDSNDSREFGFELPPGSA